MAGKILVAEVLNPEPDFADKRSGDPLDPTFALSVYDSYGDELESLILEPMTGHVLTSTDDSDLFYETELGAPDCMIESFFARYLISETGTSTVILP